MDTSRSFRGNLLRRLLDRCRGIFALGQSLENRYGVAMGNWSGKRKPKNKFKRQVKAEKRIERKAEEEASDSDEKTEDEEPASKRGSAGRSAAVSARPAVAAAQGGLASLRRKWDDLPPQVRIGTLLGLAAVAAVGLYRFIETRPTADVSGGRTPIAATAATTMPPIPLGSIPGMSGNVGTAPIAMPVPSTVSDTPSDSSGAVDAEPPSVPESQPTSEPTAAPKPAPKPVMKPVPKPVAPKPATPPASPQVDPSNPY